MNNWTEDQLMAIENRNGTLLVEAAAGSGKTAVLVERIIRRVLDRVEPVDINRFLIVTFTNMAAQEMKEKIIRAIASEISKNPRDFFLRKQLSLVHKAQISTVHSFCFNLIRENFSQLNISPDFKVDSEIDAEISKKECMNKVILDFLSNIDENFKSLVDVLGINNVEDEMIKIYNFIQSNADPIGFIEDVCKKYEYVLEEGFEKSDWFEIILEEAQKNIENAVINLEKAIDLCDSDEILQKNNEILMKSDLENVILIMQALEEKKWNKAREIAINIKFPTWKSCKKSENPDIVERSKKYRDKSKTYLSKISEILYVKLEETNEQIEKISKSVFAIRDILIRFDIVYTEDKRRRNVLDFNDAEHKVIELLMDLNTGEKTSVAHEISKKYEEIMVDEYQDTNEIQDKLFKLLSKDEKNVFMVGDVKQSIYKFRLADPMIFLRKSNEFKLAKYVKNNEPRKVALSKNFRSRNEILEATNFIFENIMTKETGEILYEGDQVLKLGANYPENQEAKTEFCLVDFDKFNRNTEIKDEKEENTREIEANVIANKINSLVLEKYQVFDSEISAMRDVNFSDIVILLRAKKYANVYKKALEKNGINIDFSEGVAELFGTPEIANFISLFKVLDNYLLDIEMVGVLRSHIFAFTDDEIAEIRLNNPNVTIYEGIKKTENSHCVEFIEKFQEIKKYSQNNSVFRTLWYVIHEFDLLAKYALMNNGEMRRNNILRFLDFVNSIDNDFSVFDFVNYINKMNNERAILPSGAKSGHRVRIITMHKSKGLEFPVVFLADTAKEFNMLDLKKSVILHNKLGVGIKYVDDDNIFSYPSLVQKAIKIKVLEELVAEEMRILYVAMTRAKEKMFVMCTMKNAEKIFKKWLETEDFLDCNSTQYWFGANIAKLPSSQIYYEKFQISNDDKIINNSLKNYFECKYITDYSNVEIKKETKKETRDFEITDLKYDYLNSSIIPSKITATSVDDGENSEIKHEKVMKKPKFISEKKISATERGIAHHIVMQFIKFENCTSEEAIKAEINRLCEEKFITKIQLEAINPQKIYAFMNSNIGKSLMKNGEIIREFKFSMLVKACEILETDSCDEVLLQGVVDCMFVQNDEIVLVDYKTDSVNEKNIDEVSLEHKRQLAIYARAIEEIFEKKVSEIYLYYFKTESFYKL